MLETDAPFPFWHRLASPSKRSLVFRPSAVQHHPVKSQAREHENRGTKRRREVREGGGGRKWRWAPLSGNDEPCRSSLLHLLSPTNLCTCARCFLVFLHRWLPRHRLRSFLSSVGGVVERERQQRPDAKARKGSVRKKKTKKK